MLGHLECFDPQTCLVPYDDPPATERYMLHKASVVMFGFVSLGACLRISQFEWHFPDCLLDAEAVRSVSDCARLESGR